MFELPGAKRVRREDLNASDDGAGSESDDGIQDVELRARLNAQIARSLGLDSHAQPPSDLTTGNSHLAGSKGSGDDQVGGLEAAGVARDDNEDEFAFRLFSSAPPAQKVVLEEDVEPTGDGGFIHGRPLSYYMVTNASAQQKQEYAIAAMSGDQVLTRSHDRAWGLELPWKVTKITVTRKIRPGEKADDDSDEAAKRKRRPGKKQRISLRKRAKTKEEKKAAEVQRLADKEEHIKDKKKRLNRLKKLRKRAKAREQKQAIKGEGGAGDDDTGDSDGDSAGS
ncbi:hypothetical protein FALBO_8744 [Fusarium albosuccineum]|uniref:Uncharacterized protein n=1 Tax=Fusarium albosuccineum TaxID=1237068 RepID=A0A8H4PJB1_9HYPO|nr:hypothetical protein FALBO_8744 [Fusarium albosuccineum]